VRVVCPLKSSLPIAGSRGRVVGPSPDAHVWGQCVRSRARPQASTQGRSVPRNPGSPGIAEDVQAGLPVAGRRILPAVVAERIHRRQDPWLPSRLPRLPPRYRPRPWGSFMSYQDAIVDHAAGSILSAPVRASLLASTTLGTPRCDPASRLPRPIVVIPLPSRMVTVRCTTLVRWLAPTVA
jgi:hypothetical protein